MVKSRSPPVKPSQVVVEPADQLPGLRVELRRRLACPLLHLREQGQFLLGRLAEEAAGGVHGVGRRLVILVVVGVVLLDAVQFTL
jgi:hypothetical protein